jgi:MATE family multidrug resistance protein
MYTGPFAVFLASVTAFYIGQGKSNVAKWWSIFGNLCNVLFDSILVFGVSGWILAMGVEGAAVATFLGYVIESICLFLVFMAKSNREKYQTNDYSFRFPLFKQCLRIGTPPAVFATLEVFAWAVFYWLMAKISFDHIFVGGICQSILFLFIFFGMGREKGAASLAGNLIGAGKKHLVNNVFISGLKLICLYSAAMLLFFLLAPDPLIDLFIKNPETIENLETSSFVITATDTLRYKEIIKQGLLLITLYLTFENMRWLLSGLLTAAGDTFFLMIAGTSSVWLFLLAPTYYFIVLGERSIIDAFYIWVAYSFLLSMVYLIKIYHEPHFSRR